MSWIIGYTRSSIGMKTLMAITGLALVLFVLVHMLGNLQVFLGPEAINSYAAAFKKMPLLLWGARIGLLTLVVVHVGAAFRLTVLNRKARPIPYVHTDYLTTSYAARTMPVSGVVLLGIILYHLAHYTLLWTNPEFHSYTDATGRHDVYAMVIAGFSNVGVTAIYILFVGLLCMHLSHGIPSFFQSLGVRHPKYTPMLEKAGFAVAMLLFVGFVSVPICVLAGIVKAVGGA